MFLSNRLFRVANSSSFRSLSQLANSEAASSSIPKPPRPHLDGKPGNAKPPYTVTRNSRGSLPVYSDIRNGGSRYLVLIRNVNGNVNVSQLLAVPNCHLKKIISLAPSPLFWLLFPFPNFSPPPSANSGTMTHTLIIRSSNQALRDDLTASLFQPGSPEAARLKLSVPRSDTLVLTGGRWKHRIMEWLRLKGF